VSRYPEGVSACVLCGHDVAAHNLTVGCQACSCAASPGEANYNERVAEPYEGRILDRYELLPGTHYVTRPVYGSSLYPKDPVLTAEPRLDAARGAVQAERERQIREAAWEEGRAAMALYLNGARRKVPYPTNPYRKPEEAQS